MNRCNALKTKLVSVVFFSAMFSSYAATAEEKVAAGYEKGFFIGSSNNDYELRTNGRLQARAQYEYRDKTKHEVSFVVPNARLSFAGHVVDPRFGFVTQFAYDKGSFKLVDFFANIGLASGACNLKIGRFLGNYSLLETNSGQKLEFNDRSILHDAWKIGAVSGVSLNSDKKNTFSWDIGAYENGISENSNKRLGGISASIGYNYNRLDPTNEPDFDGGPLRFMVLLGGFSRAQIEDWKLVGYAGNLGAMAKLFNVSLNGGFFAGVPEAGVSAGKVQKLVTDQIRLGAFGQVGYLFEKRYGVAARYALLTDHLKGPIAHEILGSVSTYWVDHNLKLQTEVGGTLMKNNSFAPLVRTQFQLAF